LEEVACRRKATIGDYCPIHARPKNPTERESILDSIKRSAGTAAAVAGAASALIKLVHDLVTTIGPHIHLKHSDGRWKQIEFSALIEVAERIQRMVSADDVTAEAVTNAEQELAELQETVSAIIKQMAGSASSRRASGSAGA
jgi:hypothetical protein